MAENINAQEPERSSNFGFRLVTGIVGIGFVFGGDALYHIGNSMNDSSTKFGGLVVSALGAASAAAAIFGKD